MNTKTETVIATTEVKRCSKCKIVKPVSWFIADKRTHDGLSSECNLCHERTCRACKQKKPLTSFISRLNKKYKWSWWYCWDCAEEWFQQWKVENGYADPEGSG